MVKIPIVVQDSQCQLLFHLLWGEILRKVRLNIFQIEDFGNFEYILHKHFPSGGLKILFDSARLRLQHVFIVCTPKTQQSREDQTTSQSVAFSLPTT